MSVTEQRIDSVSCFRRTLRPPNSALSQQLANEDAGFVWTMQELRLPDMNFAASVPGELLAIAQLRWRMFINGLRSRRGQTDLAARLLVTSFFAVGGFGGFAAATGFSWWLVSQDQAEFLAVPLWTIFVFWQLFPVMATAFTNNPDSSELLRFPLTYRSYFLVRLSYGFFDPASALGTVGGLGGLLGSGAAPHPRNIRRVLYPGHAELSVDRAHRGARGRAPAPAVPPRAGNWSAGPGRVAARSGCRRHRERFARSLPERIRLSARSRSGDAGHRISAAL